MTTGIPLSELVPLDISGVISTATDTAAFVEEYKSMIGGYMDAFGDKHRDLGSIKPVDEVAGIDMSGKNLKSVEGQSYQKLATFLRKMGFEKDKLAMRFDRVGNQPCWWVTNSLLV